MSIMQAVLIFLGLSLDSFIVMMKKGATIRDLSVRNALLYTVIYGLVDIAAVLIGYGVSYFFKNMLFEQAEIVIACLIMFALGIYVAVKSYRDSDFEEKLDKSFNLKQCFLIALATSLDTLFLGVGFSFLGIDLLRAVLLSFVVTFVTILIALSIGYTQGARYQRAVGISGGSLMIIFSIYILTHFILMR